MSENPFIGNRIEFHILQSFPVSCLNRDDVGAPKSAFIGDTPRARVSSQCWKRAVRMALHEYCGVKMAVRTRQIAAIIAEACAAAGANDEQAKSCGDLLEKIVAEGTKKKDNGKKNKKNAEADVDAESETNDAGDDGKLLLYISNGEAETVAKYCKEKNFNVTFDKNAKELAKCVETTIKTPRDGLDIALFGRMVANVTDWNIEAAASFAHAISTHKAASEVEFFTAVDDRKEQGAGHMGSLEYNSATYYRYVSLDLGTLFANLHSPAVADMEFAVAAFAKALFVAVPPARQATMSAACPWDYARVLVRKGQRLQVSFATPVAANGGKSLKEASRDALNAELDRFEKLSGSLFGKRADFAFGEDVSFSIDGLVDKLREQVGAISRGE